MSVKITNTYPRDQTAPNNPDTIPRVLSPSSNPCSLQRRKECRVHVSPYSLRATGPECRSKMWSHLQCTCNDLRERGECSHAQRKPNQPQHDDQQPQLTTWKKTHHKNWRKYNLIQLTVRNKFYRNTVARDLQNPPPLPVVEDVSKAAISRWKQWCRTIVYWIYEFYLITLPYPRSCELMKKSVSVFCSSRKSIIIRNIRMFKLTTAVFISL